MRCVNLQGTFIAIRTGGYQSSIKTISVNSLLNLQAYIFLVAMQFLEKSSAKQYIFVILVSEKVAVIEKNIIGKILFMKLCINLITGNWRVYTTAK